jgi:hypothetical protein
MLGAYVKAAATQQELAVLEQLVPQEPKQIVLLQVVHTKVTIHHVPVTHVAAVVENVKQVGQQIVKAHVSQITFMKNGLVTPTVMMAHMLLLNTVAMNVQQVL